MCLVNEWPRFTASHLLIFILILWYLMRNRLTMTQVGSRSFRLHMVPKHFLCGKLIRSSMENYFMKKKIQTKNGAPDKVSHWKIK